jgi:uncharacterized protein DUF6933
MGMVILRATKKLSSALPASHTVPTCSDTALGDWHVNRIVVDRRPLLLLVRSTSLLPLLRSDDGVIFPHCKAPELLRAKWLANELLRSRSEGRSVVH